MLATFSKHVGNVTVVRRLLFAISQLPKDVPIYWELSAKFAVQNTGYKHLDVKTAKLQVENIQKLDPLAFQSDDTLYQQLVGICGPPKKPLGVILMPVEDT